MPNIRKRSPIIITNQKSPPFKNIQAEVRKLKSFPNNVQLYIAEYHATKIAPMTKINPNNISTHLFIFCCCLFLLKRF